MSDFFRSGVCVVPSNFGPLRDADGNARLLGPCGDTMEIWISVSNGIIDDARYTSDGCFSSNKCGSSAALLAIGRSPDEAGRISAQEILEHAKDVGEESAHCALLAENTLKKTVENWHKNKHAVLRSGEKIQAAMRSIINPRPHLLVSCRGMDGRDNALVVNYGSNCSLDPSMVMVGIVPTRFSYGMVRESGCFVVNLVSPAQKGIYDYLGSHSGRDGDKIAACGAKVIKGLKVNAPILLDCPVNIECTVIDSIRTGTHEMFVGKVEYVHADRELVNQDGTVAWDRIDLL